jgi:hypothetical protein
VTSGSRTLGAAANKPPTGQEILADRAADSHAAHATAGGDDDAERVETENDRGSSAP